MKQKILIDMEIEELEEIIQQTYGHSVELVADMELNNGSYFTIKEPKQKLNIFQAQDLEKFKATGNALYRTNAIFQDLINQGKLEENTEYLVKVSW